MAGDDDGGRAGDAASDGHALAEEEQLEAVASFVSHDLSNPLGIADMYLDFARDTGEAEDFDAVEESLDRMDEMIETLVTYLRGCKPVEETEPVDVGAAARRVSGRVNGATVDVAAATTVEADPERLEELLEQLVDNAVEHGGENVTVRVGGTDDHFFVADDGPGIPADRRADVFELGHTTTENGSGVGLAIVERFAAVHGWDVSVAESESGGTKILVEG